MVLIGVFILGMVLMAVAIAFGMFLAERNGRHFVDTYVKKLTPEDVDKINQVYKEEIPEETLRALDIDEEKYRKVMGWTDGVGQSYPRDNEYKPY